MSRCLLTGRGLPHLVPKQVAKPVSRRHPLIPLVADGQRVECRVALAGPVGQGPCQGGSQIRCSEQPVTAV